MIHIDFIAGSHGNFLEFVCNTIVGANLNQTPWNSIGAAHSKKYNANKRFFANHYTTSGLPFESNKICCITISPNDLLPLSQISLLRAGNANIDNDNLEHNTFHKLNNPLYKTLLDNLRQTFFTQPLLDGYESVKDPSWPVLQSAADFDNLPLDIKKECQEIHGISPMDLSAVSPHCPRHILREFFQFGFMYPDSHGFMQLMNKFVYSSDQQVFYFEYKNFYNHQTFMSDLNNLCKWCGIEFENTAAVQDLHREFLSRQPYCQSKAYCDEIVSRIFQGEIFDLPGMDLFQESYVCAQLEIAWQKPVRVGATSCLNNSRQFFEIAG